MINSLELEEIRREYLSKQDQYNNSLDTVIQKLGELSQEIGINFEIQSRVKDVDSFIKKIIKNKYNSPFIEITDIIGARIITIYESDLQTVQNEIRRKFRVKKYDNKLDSLEYNQLGYLGVHFEISLLEQNKQSTCSNYDEICEIQLHTKAQNLWASVSHQLSYKPSVQTSIDVKRSIHRLIALIEIFDKEVSSARNAIIDQSDFPEAKLLNCLEKHFHEFSLKSFNREFSLQNLSRLKELLNENEINEFDKLVNIFTQNNKQKLLTIFSDYSNDDRETYKVLMIFQPESILIFERICNNRFRIKEFWESFLPMELLDFLASVWGISLPE